MSPISPRLLKGGILMLDPDTGIPLGSVILQYNPETPDAEAAAAERRRPGGPVRNPAAQGAGDRDHHGRRPRSTPPTSSNSPIRIRPPWRSASSRSFRRWRCWSIPRASSLIANEALTLLGTIEILPMEQALTVFVWNPSRITPVRMTSIDITEEAFDSDAQPDPRQGLAEHAGAQRQRHRIPQPGRRALHGLPDREGGAGARQFGSRPSARWRAGARHEQSDRRLHQCGRHQRRPDRAGQPLLRILDAGLDAARRNAGPLPAAAHHPAARAVCGAAPIRGVAGRPPRQHRVEPARRSAAVLDPVRRQCGGGSGAI